MPSWRNDHRLWPRSKRAAHLPYWRPHRAPAPTNSDATLRKRVLYRNKVQLQKSKSYNSYTAVCKDSMSYGISVEGNSLRGINHGDQ